MNKAATLKSHGLKATSSQSMLRSMGSSVEADVPNLQKWRHPQIRAYSTRDPLNMHPVLCVLRSG